MLRVDNIVKIFEPEKLTRKQRQSGRAEEPRVVAVDDVSFEVQDGELFTLLGPSGCGKTTTLRSIAGLERPDSGRITVDGRVLFSAASERETSLTKYPLGYDINVSANKRGLGMVFQSYAIWPHMTVFDNVAFALQARKRAERPSRTEISSAVSRVLDVMELGKFAERSATKLSGGQQQRLALARAIVTQPTLLLLDEPLSNLDAKLRESLRFELKRLQRDLGITSIYVTHDQVEALTLSSTIAVMREGKVVQIGHPREIYENPRSRFVAEFIGTSNFIWGTVAATSSESVAVETSEGRLNLFSSAAVTVGSEVIVSIRPEAMELTVIGCQGARANEWSGEVVTRVFLGNSVDHVVSVGRYELRNRSDPSVSIEPGTRVFLRMDPDKCSLVPIS